MLCTSVGHTASARPLAPRVPVAHSARTAGSSRRNLGAFSTALKGGLGRGVNRCGVLVSAAGGEDAEVTTATLDELEVSVPRDQRPSNELAALRQTNLYSWATLETSEYAKRLGIIFFVSFLFLSGPISYQTFDPAKQPIEWFLAGSVGSLFVVAVATIRIYLGWEYVGNRLLSATIPYEETGWYDGEIFVKPPEILARDRLLGTYTVRPILRKLKQTLLASGGGLLSVYFVLGVLINTGSDADGQYGRATTSPETRTGRVAADGVYLSKKVKNAADLINDDDLAEEEAAMLGNVPGYCRDRYSKAVAGGQYCKQSAPGLL